MDPLKIAAQFNQMAIDLDQKQKNVHSNLEREKAQHEADRIVANANQEIASRKLEAMTEVKNDVGNMAIGIAEKILRKELKGDSDQVSFVNTLVDNIKLN